jgi:Peptidase family M28
MSRLACRFWLLVLLAGAVLPAACEPSVGAFDLARARAHVDALGGLGSHPLGSAADASARRYIVAQLQQSGFTVRLQTADAVDPDAGLTAPVVNIIARHDGLLRRAIALVAHYDSVPEATGSLDDGIGVATCLEAGRVLAAAALRHTLFVIVTDGEEAGLMGARAVVTDTEVTGRLGAYLNFDGTGAAGSPLLFQAGPGWGDPLSAWARGAPRPDGASFGTEVYKRLPNDTDFTVLEHTGASGLNFAPIGDSYAYHTDRDVPARVASATLRLEIANTLGIVRTLDRTNLTARAVAPTFFDVARWRGVVYGPDATRAMAWTAGVVGAAAWLLLVAAVRRRGGWTGLVLTAAWSAVASGAAVASMVAAVWLIRTGRGELNPWYAAPQWFFWWLAATGALAFWCVGRLSSRAPLAVRPVRGPAATWLTTLPVWGALAGVLQWAAPTASDMVVLPLLAVSTPLVAGVVLGRRSEVPLRVASLLALIVVAALWAAKAATVLTFLVPLFGWLPLVPPVWLYPAVVAVLALMLAPPVVAALAGAGWTRARTAYVGGALVVLFAVTGIGSVLSSAYTADRPIRRDARYVQDDISHQAWWDVAGPEDAIDLGAGPEGARWAPARGPIDAAVRVAPVAAAFDFRSPAPLLVSKPPADVAAALASLPDGREAIDVTVVPHALLSLRLVLPRELEPAASTLAGRTGTGENAVWTATLVAQPPNEALTVRLTFSDRAQAALQRLAVVLTVPGLPDGTGPRGLPDWLSTATTAWRARSVFIEPAGTAGR